MIKENGKPGDLPEVDMNKATAEPDSQSVPLEERTKQELLDLYREAKEASEKNFDLYLRSQAEIENIRKRHQREKNEWRKFANETLIKNILPSLDNLEKALAHADNEQAIHALKEGIEFTLKGLKDALSKSGLVEVRALGESFDPCYHEAVSQIQEDQVKPGTVVEELQKGYLLNDRLIRPSVVVVSSSGSSSPADQGAPHEKACEKILGVDD